jgi:hypothetical protein
MAILNRIKKASAHEIVFQLIHDLDAMQADVKRIFFKLKTIMNKPLFDRWEELR